MQVDKLTPRCAEVSHQAGDLGQPLNGGVPDRGIVDETLISFSRQWMSLVEILGGRSFIVPSPSPLRPTSRADQSTFSRH
jgi:hypothetical protein